MPKTIKRQYTESSNPIDRRSIVLQALKDIRKNNGSFGMGKKLILKAAIIGTIVVLCMVVLPFFIAASDLETLTKVFTELYDIAISDKTPIAGKIGLLIGALGVLIAIFTSPLTVYQKHKKNFSDTKKRMTRKHKNELIINLEDDKALIVNDDFLYIDGIFVDSANNAKFNKTTKLLTLNLSQMITTSVTYSNPHVTSYSGKTLNFKLNIQITQSKAPVFYEQLDWLLNIDLDGNQQDEEEYYNYG